MRRNRFTQIAIELLLVVLAAVLVVEVLMVADAAKAGQRSLAWPWFAAGIAWTGGWLGIKRCLGGDASRSDSRWKDWRWYAAPIAVCYVLANCQLVVMFVYDDPIGVLSRLLIVSAALLAVLILMQAWAPNGRLSVWEFCGTLGILGAQFFVNLYAFAEVTAAV